MENDIVHESESRRGESATGDQKLFVKPLCNRVRLTELLFFRGD